MKTQTTAGRRIWPWAAASLLLHLLVLASVPGVDTPARCPVMLVSLVTTHAAEKKVEVVKPDPVLPPEQLQKGTPRVAKPTAKPKHPEIRQVAAKAKTTPKKEPVKTAPAQPVTTPIVTSNTSAENTAVVPDSPSAVPPAVPPGPPAQPSSGDSKPVAPASGGTPRGEGGQSGTADRPAPEPARPAIDVKALMRQYGANAIAKVQRSKYFPDSARTEERSGTVVTVNVSFSIASDGSLASVSASGGDIPELTRAAEDAVRRAAPFGRFPEGVTKPSQSYTTRLEYKLR